MGTRDGAFVSGMALEGARWNIQQGMLEKSKPREMYFEMPVVYCKSNFAASRPSTGIYSCPVYKTRQRGPTYVFSAQLKTNLRLRSGYWEVWLSLWTYRTNLE